MKRFKLTRQEKLLFATPLLLPLLVLAWSVAWPLVSVDSFERSLQDLAGPDAVDCGIIADREAFHWDSCVTAAFVAGKPVIVRNNVSGAALHRDARGMVRTPQGQVYFLFYNRPLWGYKVLLRQFLIPNARISTEKNGRQFILFGTDKKVVKETRVWW